MTKFNPTQFTYDGMYLQYQGQFVARFKRGGKAEFVRFLVKNFTVEEYFFALERLQPMEILQHKGFVSPAIKKVLKIWGFEPTQAGMQAYLARV
jgi:hypothetical protein